MKEAIIIFGTILISLGIVVGCAKKELEGVEAEEAFRKVESAVEAGNITKLESLLKKNPEFIRARDIDGRTLVHEAITEGKRNLLEMVKLLVSKGADVNAKDLDGNSALHRAAQSAAYHGTPDNFAVLEFLIEQGADVNAKRNDGKTPIDHATPTLYNSDRRRVRDLLIKHGAYETK